jgi:hypothetical protein
VKLKVDVEIEALTQVVISMKELTNLFPKNLGKQELDPCF